MDLARLRLSIAAGRYAVDPVAVADAVLRVPGLALLLVGPRPTAG